MLDRDHALSDMHNCVAVGPFEVSFNTRHKRPSFVKAETFFTPLLVVKKKGLPKLLRQVVWVLFVELVYPGLSHRLCTDVRIFLDLLFQDLIALCFQ